MKPHRPIAFGSRQATVTRLLICVALFGACKGSGGPGGTWDVPEVDRKIILPWLLCTDCIEGELDHVVNRGTRLVPYLSAALLDGPRHADDSLAEMRAIDAVRRIKSYRDRRPGQLSPLTPAESSATVLSQLDAFRLTYRLRAAQALLRIDSVRAAADVADFCEANPPELQRNPQYRSSFKAIGSCQ